MEAPGDSEAIRSGFDGDAFARRASSREGDSADRRSRVRDPDCVGERVDPPVEYPSDRARRAERSSCEWIAGAKLLGTCDCKAARRSARANGKVRAALAWMFLLIHFRFLSQTPRKRRCSNSPWIERPARFLSRPETHRCWDSERAGSNSIVVARSTRWLADKAATICTRTADVCRFRG